MVKSNSSNFRHQPASSILAFARLRIHFKAWWFLWIEKWVPLRYSCKSSTSQTTAGHLRQVASGFFSAWRGMWDQYNTGFVIPSGRFYSSTHPTWRSHASMSSVSSPSARGRGRTGGLLSSSFSLSWAASFSSVSCARPFLLSSSDGPTAELLLERS